MKSGAKNGPGIRARFWSLLVLAQLPKAQKTGPFLGPHFGAGEPLLSSFLESQIWARIEKCRPMPPVLPYAAGQGKRPVTACLEHTFAFNSQVETCCVYSLTNCSRNCTLVHGTAIQRPAQRQGHAAQRARQLLADLLGCTRRQRCGTHKPIIMWLPLGAKVLEGGSVAITGKSSVPSRL